MKTNDPIFNNFNQPFEETELFKTYKFVLIKKPKKVMSVVQFMLIKNRAQKFD